MSFFKAICPSFSLTDSLPTSLAKELEGKA